MALFRRVRTARVVALPTAHSDLLRNEQPSLFLAGALTQRYGDQANGSVVAPYGSIRDVGFAAGWAEPLSSSPPRNMNYCRNNYSDRFFHARPGDCGSRLALVEINERLVEDTYMRGSIDYTGFEVIVIFNPDAYRVFAELVDIDKPWDHRDAPGFVLSVPTPTFSFPAQRGSPDPGGARIEYAKELRPIKKLDVREMVIALVNTRPKVQSVNTSVLDRFEILSATKLTLARD